MLCLLGNASQLRPLSFVSCLIHFSFVPCPMYFLSHVFRVSFISFAIFFVSHFVRCLICFMSRLKSCHNSQVTQAAQAMSQHSDRVSNNVSIQATSCNLLYLTRTEIGSIFHNQSVEIRFLITFWDHWKHSRSSNLQNTAPRRPHKLRTRCRAHFATGAGRETMATNLLSTGIQHPNITEYGVLTIEYLKSIDKKIKTSNRITIEQVEKIIRVSIEYAETTNRGSTPAQMWQKLESIKSLAKEQSQKQNGINDKLTVLTKQEPGTITSSKPQTWAAIATNEKIHPLLYNKNNKIVVTLNDAALAEEMKKQALKKVANGIDDYLVENNITATKLRAAQTLPRGDIAIQTINEEEAEKWRGEDGWTKMLGSKAKLACKRYGIVALGILIAKIDMEKPEETKEKMITQNDSICAGIKIESIFWLFTSKQDSRILSLVVEVADVKMANMLIEEELVLDHTLHGCMRYKSICRMNQCFNYYEYGHVSVHFQKSTKYEACSGFYRASECP